MKVMLKENVEDLGKKGDIVRVAPGFGRNYLIPKKIALEVTSTNTKMIEMVQKALHKGLEKEMASYRSQAEKLSAVTLTFERKAGEKDHIFGSVSVTAIPIIGYPLSSPPLQLSSTPRRTASINSSPMFSFAMVELNATVCESGRDSRVRETFAYCVF